MPFYLRPLFEERNWIHTEQWISVYQIKEHCLPLH